MVLFKLQRHGDHHVHSTRRYQTLRAEPSRSPQVTTTSVGERRLTAMEVYSTCGRFLWLSRFECSYFRRVGVCAIVIDTVCCTWYIVASVPFHQRQWRCRQDSRHETGGVGIVRVCDRRRRSVPSSLPFLVAHGLPWLHPYGACPPALECCHGQARAAAAGRARDGEGLASRTPFVKEALPRRNQVDLDQVTRRGERERE